MSCSIRVENLSKSFLLTQRGAPRYLALRDEMAAGLKRIFSFPEKLRPSSNNPLVKETFWALKDIHLEIKKGERVGIIGRNGAGKSTLLKILSRITEPTSGRIQVRGRVASLLEVGTGFHPELTGRENIFLNGAILGMSRIEIRKKFDEVVAFAGVEKFLDTPVKRYSSGMHVRLAFAVAAHLEPEILVVDEVLAVGDGQFQKKCLGKMEDVSSKEGRTVLFVSHQMDAIERLTTKAVLLEAGKVRKFGETAGVVGSYLHQPVERATIEAYRSRKGNGAARLLRLDVLCNHYPAHVLRPGQPFQVLMGIETEGNVPLDAAFVLENGREQPLFCSHLTDANECIKKKGYTELTLEVDVTSLRRGAYLASVSLFRPDRSEFYDVVLHFPLLTIEGSDDSQRIPFDDRWGNFYFSLNWSGATRL